MKADSGEGFRKLFNRDGWILRLSKRMCITGGYCSILGLKVAFSVGFVMLLTLMSYLLLHEYRAEGMAEVRELLASPLLWAGMAFSFISLMIILSKLVILPLKRFEMHISELEKGVKTGPFELKRKDELGFLASKFNNLYRIVTSEIESKDMQLTVIYNFTNATSGIVDIQVLMDNFFNILRTAVDFDLGAYYLTYQNNTEGKIYSAFQNLSEEEAAEITRDLLKRTKRQCPGVPKETITLEVSALRGQSKAQECGNAAATVMDLPILCFGRPIGLISLTFTNGSGQEISRKVFSAMVRHTSIIIERLLAHISAEEKKLNNILSSMSEGVYIIDRYGHATSINKKGLELINSYCGYGLDCARAADDGNLGSCPAPTQDLCEFSNLINKVRRFGPEFEGKVYTEEIKNKSGMVLQLSISDLKTEDNRKEGYVIVAKDISQDRLIQNRVMLSSKLAALGEMAAGIAHEVNNPLQVMMANIELLEASVNDSGIKRIDNLREGVLRIKGIIRDLLIFAREQTTEVEDIEINHVITKVVDLLRNQLKIAGVAVETNLDRRALVVRCNNNLFQQVIINLLQNAKDAIEESKKGSKVYVRTVLLPGGIVVVEVADDGPGIPESVVDRIFDPFFTTKDVGKGTGLGLSVSRRIIEGMGGNISVSSSPRTGTTFTITLVHNRNARRKEDRHKAVEPDYSSLAGKKVLMVDDEEGVSRAVRDGLAPMVSSIALAGNGESGFNMVTENDYDFILMDVKMPGMNGMELFRRIADEKPYLAQRVIFLTGDTENEATETFMKLTGCRYLSKPFTMKELLKVMCEYDPEPTDEKPLRI